MLELGLQRISRLVDATKLRWRAVHVAGTNGKGSVCSSLYAMLNAAQIPTGMFTSPHLIDRWDGISLRGKTIEQASFLDIEEQVKARNAKLTLEATEFELLTATAFEAFNRAKVEVGVVEVGVGGRLDATNVLQNPLATVITNISRDHEALLGDTLEKIAEQKAGIMKPRSACLVDGTNVPQVRAVLSEKAREMNTRFFRVIDPLDEKYKELICKQTGSQQLTTWQLSNLTLAYEACQIVLDETGITSRTASDLLPHALRSPLPGRKQQLSIERVTGYKLKVLLDGAHNLQAVQGLGTYVNNTFRTNDRKHITWILAFTDNKDAQKLVPLLMVKRGDDVIAVEFGPVDGMPWVKPLSASTIAEVAEQVTEIRHVHAAESVEEALRKATEICNEDRRIVIAGSLYLVSDVLRLLKRRGASDGELGLVQSAVA